MIRNMLRRIRQWLLVGVARKEDLDNLYNQVAGLSQIAAAMRGDPIINAFRGWTLSSDAIAWILLDLQERQSPTIMEFGGGQSTVILASVMKRRGGGRLVTVEHDSAYAAELRQQLAACGLEENVEMHLLPLESRQISDQSPPCLTYPVEQLPDIAVDLALVDGPPLLSGNHTRFFPIRWTLQHLRPGGAIYLDDANRPAEQEVLALVQQHFPELSCVRLTTQKGLALLKTNR